MAVIIKDSRRPSGFNGYRSTTSKLNTEKDLTIVMLMPYPKDHALQIVNKRQEKMIFLPKDLSNSTVIKFYCPRKKDVLEVLRSGVHGAHF